MYTDEESGALMRGRTWADVLRLVSQTLGKAGHLVLPSPIQRWFSGEVTAPEKVMPTSYLDGLRGVVSLFVVVRHYSEPWQKGIDIGYGQDGRFDIFRLPFLRLLYAGPSVPIFFIVSGYVLSLKPLRLTQQKSFDKLLLSLSASVFCRALRLFLPPLIMTFGVMVAVQFGLYNFSYDRMPGRHPHHPPHLNSWWLQLGDWLRSAFLDLTNPWDWETRVSEYGSYLWTISLQFRGSMLLFLTVLGLARVRARLRPVLMVALLCYCMLMSRWDAALFLGGMMMALNDVTSDVSLGYFNNDKQTSWRHRREIFTTVCSVSSLLTGLYVGSFPRDSRGCRAPGFTTMCHISPNYRTWYAIGALLIVSSMRSLEHMQSPFNSAFPRYLGKISFSLYIVHVPVLHIIGYSLVPFMWRFTGSENMFQYQLGFALGLVPLFLLLWFVADAFWRLVDQPCAKFTQWVSSKCFQSQSVS